MGRPRRPISIRSFPRTMSTIALPHVEPLTPAPKAARWSPWKVWGAILLAPYAVEREREIYEVRSDLARQYAPETALNAVVGDPPTA